MSAPCGTDGDGREAVVRTVRRDQFWRQVEWSGSPLTVTATASARPSSLGLSVGIEVNRAGGWHWWSVAAHIHVGPFYVRFEVDCFDYAYYLALNEQERPIWDDELNGRET